MAAPSYGGQESWPISDIPPEAVCSTPTLHRLVLTTTPQPLHNCFKSCGAGVKSAWSGHKLWKKYVTYTTEGLKEPRVTRDWDYMIYSEILEQ